MGELSNSTRGTLPVHRLVTVPGIATVTWMIPAHILVSGETFLSLWERVQCHRLSKSHSSAICATHKLASWLEQVKDEGGKKPENVEGLCGQDYPYHEFSKK